MQLTQRRQGNILYQESRFADALKHYSSAMSMVEPITGRADQEQQEVDANLVKVYLNIAAVHLQQQHHGAAITWCTKALKKDRSNKKALLRRAKAHLGRHNYQVYTLLIMADCLSKHRMTCICQCFLCVVVSSCHGFCCTAECYFGPQLTHPARSFKP